MNDILILRHRYVPFQIAIFLFVVVAVFFFSIGLYFCIKTKNGPTPASDTSVKSIREDATQRALSSMTIEEKVGQLFFFGISGTTLSDDMYTLLHNTHAGGVLLMNKSLPQTFQPVIASIRSLPSRIPLFIAYDGEIERMKSIDDTYDIQARIAPDEEFCAMNRKIAKDLADNGFTMNFGIIADIGWQQSGYITERTYGSTVEDVTSKVRTALRCSDGILNAVKHFPGHGTTADDSHTTIPVISNTLSEWEHADAIPFGQAFDMDVPVLMVGHLVYDAFDETPASLSPKAHQKARAMGFNGIIITDDLHMLENQNRNPVDTFLSAVNAGNDMVLYVTDNLEGVALYQNVLDAVRRGDISLARIEESVLRILRIKYLTLGSK